MPSRDLDAYGRDYHPDGAPAPADRGIRASDRYVLDRDPLRAAALASAGERAEVRLGVDPGTFFCGHHFANLCDLADHATPRPLVGFIHVPPDRASGPLAAAASHLHPRVTNRQHLARVLATALRELAAPGERRVLITGFGPFEGVAQNPTAAFVADPAALELVVTLALPGARLEQSIPLRVAEGARHTFRLPGGARLHLHAAVLHLAATDARALAGHYHPPERLDDLARALWHEVGPTGPDAAIGLGVDSSQLSGAIPPTFKIETQTRGWQRGAARGRTATDDFRRDLDLARLFLRARDRADDRLLDHARSR